MIEQTLVLVKPDGVQRGLIGEIVKRFEQRGLKIVGLKMIQPQKTLAEQHYTEEISKKHGEKVRQYLLDYITNSPVIAMIIQGVNAIENVRKIVGSTYPGEADLGTIRGDFAHVSKAYAKKMDQGRNLVHASENQKDAERELKLWFSQDEIYNYKLAGEEHLL